MVNDVITPNAIVTGPDGNLWTASNDKVLKITTADPANPTLFTLNSTMSPAARGIASAGGLIWVVDFSGAIVAMTTAGVQTPHAVGGGPQEVAGGPGGQVLFSNPLASPQHVGRLIAGGLPQTTDRPLADPFGIAFGQDGAYWVAEFAAGRLARVTAGGEVTTLGGLPTNSPREITTGPGNTLWVSLELSNKVARITGVDPPAPPVVPPPAPPPLTPPVVAADRTAPVITRLRISPPRFRRASGNKAAAKVSMTLSEAATVRFTAERVRVGRRVASKCVAPTARNRARTLCVRTTPAGRSRFLSSPSGASVSASWVVSCGRCPPVATAWWPSRAMRPGTGPPRRGRISSCSLRRCADAQPGWYQGAACTAARSAAAPPSRTGSPCVTSTRSQRSSSSGASVGAKRSR